MPGAASAFLSAWQALLLLGTIDTAMKYMEYRNGLNHEDYQMGDDVRVSQEKCKVDDCDHYPGCGDDVHAEQCNKCKAPGIDNERDDAKYYLHHKECGDTRYAKQYTGGPRKLQCNLSLIHI